MSLDDDVPVPYGVLNTVRSMMHARTLYLTAKPSGEAIFVYAFVSYRSTKSEIFNFSSVPLFLAKELYFWSLLSSEIASSIAGNQLPMYVAGQLCECWMLVRIDKHHWHN